MATGSLYKTRLLIALNTNNNGSCVLTKSDFSRRNALAASVFLREKNFFGEREAAIIFSIFISCADLTQYIVGN